MAKKNSKKIVIKGGKLRKERGTKLETMSVVTAVLKLLLLEVPRHDMMQKLREMSVEINEIREKAISTGKRLPLPLTIPEEGYHERTLDKYIGAAYKELERITNKDREQNINLAQNQLKDLYNKSLDKGDLRTALEVRKALNNLLGLDQPMQVDVNAKVVTISMDDLKRSNVRVYENEK
jgi:hypothetical protein